MNFAPGKSDLRVVGTRPVRPDGADKVAGKAQYGADLHLPGMLVGKVLRSPHAHARILSIDTAKALAVPGVKGPSPRPTFPTSRARKPSSAKGRSTSATCCTTASPAARRSTRAMSSPPSPAPPPPRWMPHSP